MPDPINDEELYDSIVLSGVRSPGTVKISGHDRTVGWDVKKGPGLSGATTTRTGDDPMEPVCTFYLADEFDFAAWVEFQALIESSVSSKTPRALDIYHPDLATQQIKSVVKKKIAGVVHDGKGGQTIAVTFLEYKPPKPATGSPKPKPKGPDPDAAALAELAGLTDRFKEAWK